MISIRVKSILFIGMPTLFFMHHTMPMARCWHFPDGDVWVQESDCLASQQRTNEPAINRGVCHIDRLPMEIAAKILFFKTFLEDDLFRRHPELLLKVMVKTTGQFLRTSKRYYQSQKLMQEFMMNFGKDNGLSLDPAWLALYVNTPVSREWLKNRLSNPDHTNIAARMLHAPFIQNEPLNRLKKIIQKFAKPVFKLMLAMKKAEHY